MTMKTVTAQSVWANKNNRNRTKSKNSKSNKTARRQQEQQERPKLLTTSKLSRRSLGGGAVPSPACPLPFVSILFLRVLICSFSDVNKMRKAKLDESEKKSRFHSDLDII